MESANFSKWKRDVLNRTGQHLLIFFAIRIKERSTLLQSLLFFYKKRPYRITIGLLQRSRIFDSSWRFLRVSENIIPERVCSERNPKDQSFFLPSFQLQSSQAWNLFDINKKLISLFSKSDHLRRHRMVYLHPAWIFENDIFQKISFSLHPFQLSWSCFEVITRFHCCCKGGWLVRYRYLLVNNSSK